MKRVGDLPVGTFIDNGFVEGFVEEQVCGGALVVGSVLDMPFTEVHLNGDLELEDSEYELPSFEFTSGIDLLGEVLVARSTGICYLVTEAVPEAIRIPAIGVIPIEMINEFFMIME